MWLLNMLNNMTLTYFSDEERKQSVGKKSDPAIGSFVLQLSAPMKFWDLSFDDVYNWDI